MRKLTQEYKDIANNFNLNCIKNRLKFHEPFQIDIKFDVGRQGNSFLFFDAVVAHFTFLYVLKEKFFHISADFDQRLHIDIPIQKKFYNDKNGDRDYFYLCGGFFNIPEKVSYFCKRTDEPVVPIIKNRRIKTNGGILKNYKLPILYDIKKYYQIKGIGDIELLEKILPKKINIGKKTAVGFGNCKIKIKAINKLELLNNNEKKYIRPVPVEYLKQKKLPIINKINSVYRPPYYGRNAIYKECGI
jgi:hypothetical protein